MKVTGDLSRCDYCGRSVDPVRPTPYMADMTLRASMCERCWEISRVRGLKIEDIDIGSFRSVTIRREEVR